LAPRDLGHLQAVANRLCDLGRRDLLVTQRRPRRRLSTEIAFRIRCAADRDDMSAPATRRPAARPDDDAAVGIFADAGAVTSGSLSSARWIARRSKACIAFEVIIRRSSSPGAQRAARSPDGVLASLAIALDIGR